MEEARATLSISTVHDALNKAAESSPLQSSENPSRTVSFRIPESERALASDICTIHGTTLSAYLRHCCRLLIQDYGGKPDPKE